MDSLKFNVLTDEFPPKSTEKNNSLKAFLNNKKNGILISPENKISWQRYLETLGVTAACIVLEKKLWEHDDLHDYQISHKIISKFSTLISELQSKFPDKKDTLYKHIIGLFYKEVRKKVTEISLNNEDIRSYIFNILKSKYVTATNSTLSRNVIRSSEIAKKIS